jgi:3-phosphoshikimate 1-carboxyvinyltransferase
MAQDGPAEGLRRPLDELEDPLPVPPLAPGRGAGATFFARIRPPGSKSLTNRAVLLAGLASGQSTIRGALLDADDTERMLAAIALLGAGVERGASGDLRITGVGGRWRPSEAVAAALRLDLGNAGTATRFLAASAILSPEPLLIDGNARMRQRPIGELGDALESLGATVEYLQTAECPPLQVTPPDELPSGARLELPETASSQFISGLLLIAPWLPGGLTLTLGGRVTSRSYIVMTLGLLDILGARVRTSGDLRVIRVSAGSVGLGAFSYDVEPDASSAVPFWAAAALFPGAVCRAEGLDARSLQGDALFPELLGRMGAQVVREEATAQAAPSIGLRGPATLNPVMADLSQVPDAAMALAAVACFVPGTGRSILRGLRTLRVKESDRIAGLQRELAKIGVKVETSVLGDPDAMTITPPPGGVDCSPSCDPVVFDTYDDHRMAMALALIGLRRPGVRIRNPRCIAKTFPGFWREFAGLY